MTYDPSLMLDWRLERCLCGAAACIIAEFNYMEGRMEGRRRHHRIPNGPCKNLRHIRGCHNTTWKY